MSESLGQKQRRFAAALPLLIVHARMLGFEVALGEASRTDEQAEINAMGPLAREGVAKLIEAIYKDLAAAIRNNGRAGGIRNSLHQLRLAIDLHLYKDGVYQTDTEAHRELGTYWESLAPDHAWGGHFGDGNHYAITHNGVR